MIYCDEYYSPIGKMLIAANENALVGTWFFSQKYFPDKNEYIVCDKHEIILKTKDWLNRYFAGEKPCVDIPLFISGTVFQKKVWDILLKIPYGDTVTYSDIAKNFSYKMSAQAVGGAVSRNPFSIIVPCHRVIGKGGALTGYAGGKDKKLWLIRHENIISGCF